MILMAAGFLTGCMETSEDECIVKEKETETGDSIRPYSSGTEAVENVSVAEQVQAASPCMLSVEEGKIHVDLQASVYLPQGNSMKIYKAKTRYFTQEDMNGWMPYPDAGTAAEKRQRRYDSLAGTAGTYRNGEDDRSVCFLGGGRQESVSV